MDRRAFLLGVLPATGAALALGPAARAGATDARRELTVTPITDRLLLVAGAGGNVTLFDTPEGVLLVDGGGPERAADLLRLVERRTGRARVHTLFNTHWHWEQTGSNRVLGPAGTRIVAHENTRLWLGTEIRSKWQDRVFEPLPREARPNDTFYTTGALDFGGERIEYGHLPQAHTDGDAYVYFRQANVLVAGDVVAAGAYPVLDYSTNGWIGGMADAVQSLLEITDASTRIVAGSGPVLGRAHLEAQHAMLTTLKRRLSELLAQGMSAQDMLEAGATREFDAQWGDPTQFVTSVWHGLVPRARELGVSIV